eukprot:TRINITY_DN31615_c1_g1_i1.p1 TRINITY_DN31615_c1_g1~~TRINITY_DN31615_c1_g1_i1.p1  ORF type:complete len:137 (-),score=12.61 TRINITY_DN31615_c1_g1_i1:29-439(-)
MEKQKNRYYPMVGGNLVSWKSEKLVVTAKSSVEAEYSYVAHGCCELLLWLRILLDELGFKQDGPMFLYSDITSAIKLANNLVYHEKTKHVEVVCHFIHEKTKEDVLLVHAPIEDQLAYFLKKVKLSCVLFCSSWAL